MLEVLRNNSILSCKKMIRYVCDICIGGSGAGAHRVDLARVGKPRYLCSFNSFLKCILKTLNRWFI